MKFNFLSKVVIRAQERQVWPLMAGVALVAACVLLSCLVFAFLFTPVSLFELFSGILLPLALDEGAQQEGFERRLQW